MKVLHGFDVFRMYLALKQHFSNETYDFYRYEGKVNAKEETYQQRNDFYFFETLARKLSYKEAQEYFIASFILAEDPKKVWIGDIKRDGKDSWLVWQKQIQSRTYLFEQDLSRLVAYMERAELTFNDLFQTSGGHPPLLKLHLKGQISFDTLLIMDIILRYTNQWDKRLRDPLWERISFKIKKCKPFMSITKDKYKQLLKRKFL